MKVTCVYTRNRSKWARASATLEPEKYHGRNPVFPIAHSRLLSATINGPLFDTHRISTNLERAYEAMWEVRNMGLSTRHIGEYKKTMTKDKCNCAEASVISVTISASLP